MMYIPETLLIESAKAIVTTEGKRYDGLSVADKKFYQKMARACIMAFIAAQIRPEPLKGPND